MHRPSRCPMNDFRIGGHQYNSTERFKGWIDEVKVYNLRDQVPFEVNKAFA